MKKIILIDDIEIKMPRKRKRAESKAHYMRYLRKIYMKADEYDMGSMALPLYVSKVNKNVRKLYRRANLYYDHSKLGKFKNFIYFLTHEDQIKEEKEINKNIELNSRIDEIEEDTYESNYSNDLEIIDLDKEEGWLDDDSLDDDYVEDEFVENIQEKQVENEFSENLNETYCSDELHEIVLDEDEFSENVDKIVNESYETDKIIRKVIDSLGFYQEEVLKLKLENAKLEEENRKNEEDIKELKGYIEKLYNKLFDYQKQTVELSTQVLANNKEDKNKFVPQENIMTDYAFWMAKKEDSDYETSKVIEKNYADIFGNKMGDISINSVVDTKNIKHQQYIKTR